MDSIYQEMPPVSNKVKTTIDKLTAERDELLRQNAAMLAEQATLNTRILALQTSLHDARFQLIARAQELTDAKTFKCACGQVMAKSSKAKHLKSPTHIMRMNCVVGDQKDANSP
jgi:recombinational DNA repair ATPase RecF